MARDQIQNLRRLALVEQARLPSAPYSRSGSTNMIDCTLALGCLIKSLDLRLVFVC